MESITPNRTCTLCKTDIYQDGSLVCCDCYEIYIADLESGILDYPKFWVEKEGGDNQSGETCI